MTLIKFMIVVDIYRWMLAEENLPFISKSQLLLTLLEVFGFTLGNLGYFFLN